jgi:hypothetical protein
MPSYLTTPNPNTFEQQLQRAVASVQRNTIKSRSPWLGYMPDIDPHRIPPNGTIHSRGLIARPDPGGHGEVLMPDDGFQLLQPTDNPLGTAPDTPIVMLFELPRSNATGEETGEYQRTVMAVCAGSTPVAGESTLEIIDPSTGLWTVVPFTDGRASGGADELGGGRDHLFDVAVMYEGTSTRTVGGGAINQPVAVFCNGISNVMVFPGDIVGGAEDNEYDVLTNDLGADFIAHTVEAFNGRLYFGDVTENNIRYRQRIRRTPVFNADPDPGNIGAGALDIREFSGNLLRLEKLGQVMAAYFEDGTAFIRSTDVATSPDAVQILRETRGLISTHSVVSVEDQKHFGIFDDGWFFLDASGRWQEVGLVEIDGVKTHKWKRTFYENLDIENRNRLYISYDDNLIRIAYPRVGTSSEDIEEVWIYDPKNDRIFIEDYKDGNNITCWGLVEHQLAVDLLWDESSDATYAEFGGDNWSTIFASWAQVGAKFGLKALVHGNNSGHVLVHDPDMVQRWNTSTNQLYSPTYVYHSPLTALGEPRLIKTVRQLWVEYIHANSPNMSVQIVGNSTKMPEVGVLDLTPIGRVPGEVLTAKRHFNISDTELGFELTGTTPILIRSIETDYVIKLQEERD